MNNINLLQSALSASSLRQQAISNNIANAETPGYKAKQVVFENILKQQLTSQTNLAANRTNTRHILFGNSPADMVTPQTVSNPNSVIQNNGNNVDLEQEMTLMAKNSLWYDTLTEQLNSEFQQLSIAIRGRG